MQHRSIRALLTSMAPKRAVDYIKSFGLPEDEERCLIERDVHQKSCIQIAYDCGMSEETVKRKRQRAYKKIADQINHR